MSRSAELVADEDEFAEVRWWSRGEIAATDPAEFDPHFARFLAKVPPH